jgi:DNA adenine methylase
LKWVGGKTRTADVLAALVPEGTKRYVEPFMGSAAVFFALAPEAAVLGDLNEDLAVAFQEIRRDPEAVMAAIDTMPNTEADFLRIRALDVATLPALERAARVVYLNKTCFRGLWRVNRRGQFNVPYGAYDRPLYNRDTLLGAAQALEGAEVRHADFEAILAEAEPGDWVYLDPPYVPAGGYSDFKRYTPGQFREDDHERLVACCRRLDAAGIPFVLTNTDNNAVRSLYDGFHLASVPTRRDVNLDSRRRGSTDLVVSNYDVSGPLAAAFGAPAPLFEAV